MELEPDAYHEGEKGFYVDCPECGSPAYLADIIEDGRCQGYLGEVVDDGGASADREPTCTAELSLELVWGS